MVIRSFRVPNQITTNSLWKAGNTFSATVLRPLILVNTMFRISKKDKKNLFSMIT